jgi:hypothetical protein
MLSGFMINGYHNTLALSALAEDHACSGSIVLHYIQPLLGVTLPSNIPSTVD